MKTGALTCWWGNTIKDGLRIYRNQGTNQQPKFDQFQWFQNSVTGRLVAFLPAAMWDSRRNLWTSTTTAARICSPVRSWPSSSYFGRSADGTFQEGQILVDRDGELIRGRFFPGDRTINYNSTITMADWDNDGDGDLIMGRSRFSWIRNIGTSRVPVFEKAQPIYVGDQLIQGGNLAPCVADWDGDGHQDLICGLSGNIVWYRHRGNPGVPGIGGAADSGSPRSCRARLLPFVVRGRLQRRRTTGSACWRRVPSSGGTTGARA